MEEKEKTQQILARLKYKSKNYSEAFEDGINFWRNFNKEPKIIENEFIEHLGDNEIYYMPDGNKIKIGVNALDFFRKVKTLPISYKITLLDIKEDEYLEYVNELKTKRGKELFEKLKERWFYRETGEEAEFLDKEECFLSYGYELNKIQLMGKIQRGTIKLDILFNILNWFEETDEIYLENS